MLAAVYAHRMFTSFWVNWPALAFWSAALVCIINFGEYQLYNRVWPFSFCTSAWKCVEVDLNMFDNVRIDEVQKKDACLLQWNSAGEHLGVLMSERTWSCNKKLRNLCADNCYDVLQMCIAFEKFWVIWNFPFHSIVDRVPADNTLFLHTVVWRCAAVNGLLIGCNWLQLNAVHWCGMTLQAAVRTFCLQKNLHPVHIY